VEAIGTSRTGEARTEAAQARMERMVSILKNVIGSEDRAGG
jgi:hypothetical protein